jgi:hypothetical protein
MWGTLSFWLPLYLNKVRGWHLKHIALFAWLPFLAAYLGCVFGGLVSATLQKRHGMSVVNARRAAFTLGALLMTSVAFAGRVSSPYTAILVFSIGRKVNLSDALVDDARKAHNRRQNLLAMKFPCFGEFTEPRVGRRRVLEFRLPSIFRRDCDREDREPGMTDAELYNTESRACAVELKSRRRAAQHCRGLARADFDGRRVINGFVQDVARAQPVHDAANGRLAHARRPRQVRAGDRARSRDGFDDPPLAHLPEVG